MIRSHEPYRLVIRMGFFQKNKNPPLTETKQEEEEEHRFSHIHSFKQQEAVTQEATTTRTSFIQTTIIQNKKQWQWEERN